MIIFTGCKKEEGDCNVLDNKIAAAKATFNASRTHENCHAVAAAYDDYIGDGGPDAESYKNSRDAFADVNGCP